ncbi:C-terminal binding protein [Marinobacter bohaiensis]|uniref:C-terminal binding protein n=1 Tax=Marinobacter bohaiensis TaxID=2201898 RepID=UPI000DAE2C94|nr:C-terminal binding protein [Marinobacter bohaiensis]
MIDTGYETYDIEQAILNTVGARIREIPCHGDLERILETVREADAVMVRESPLPRDIIEQMNRCQVIVRYGAGIDNIDLEAAAERGIFVANVPDYGFEEVSDQALALLMTVARRTASRDQQVRAGAWNIARQEPMHRITGGVLGLVGYGRIARAFHRKAMGLGFSRTLVVDHHLKDSTGDVETVDLDTLCREADVISLHVPLTDQTRHLIDRRRLALMKPNAVLINTARGGLIDEPALAATLKNGRLFGAGLDVFEQEPPQSDSPLMDCPGVVISDHTGWYSEESIAELQRKAAEEVCRVFNKEPPINWVNRWDHAS